MCVHNAGYEVSLERRKLYEVLPDPAAAKHGLLRVVDESGEDYLYPEDFFLPVEDGGFHAQSLGKIGFHFNL